MFQPPFRPLFRTLTRRLGVSAICLGAALPTWAASKEERLQIQIASLQGQIADLQRQVEDATREVKRLNEALAEQSALLKRATQDQRTQDEAIQTSIRELGERMAEFRERFQAVPAAPSFSPTQGGTVPAEPSPSPGTGSPAPAPTGGGTPPPPRELYSQAYADYARGNYDLAVQGFQEYVRNYPNTDFSDNAQYWIGECHYGKQRYAEAIEAWNTLLRDYASSDKLPDARVKKGMALEKQGRRSQALLEYRYVVDRYPNSPAARIARDRLNPQ
jgi:tol-pal system protein YbgF